MQSSTGPTPDPVLLPLAVAALLVALPRYAVVWHRTDGAWVRDFLLAHNVGRFSASMEGHGGPASDSAAAPLAAGSGRHRVIARSKSLARHRELVVIGPAGSDVVEAVARRAEGGRVRCKAA